MRWKQERFPDARASWPKFGQTHQEGHYFKETSSKKFDGIADLIQKRDSGQQCNGHLQAARPEEPVVMTYAATSNQLHQVGGWIPPAAST